MSTEQDTSQSTEKEQENRPILIWVLFIYATYSLSSLVGYYFIISGDIVLEGLAGDYHQNLTNLDHAFNVLTPFYFFLCALQLFRLKVVALKLYLGYIPLMIALLTNNLFSPAWRALVEAEPLGYFSQAISFILYFAYVVYAYQLTQKGVLK